MLSSHEEPSPRPARAAEPLPRTRPDRPATVLVVDDEPDFLAVVHEVLDGEPFVVRTAASAAEALRLALVDPPNLVVLDLLLGPDGADGFEVLRALRAEPSTAQVLVFACSGLPVGDGRRILRAGFDAHFPKPVDWAAFRKLLHRLFAQDE